MKFFIILILPLFISSSSFKVKNCIKGDFEYSAADYTYEIFLKPNYQKLFNSLLQKPITDCFCKQKIEDLPTKNYHKINNSTPSKSIIIEPIFVDLSNFDGLYTKRVYSLGPKSRNPRFRCGYYHYTFILSDKKYIPLTNDTIKNEGLIMEHLKNSFSEEVLSMMKNNYKYDIICDDFTHLPPVLIKRCNSILFDALKNDNE